MDPTGSGAPDADRVVLLVRSEEARAAILRELHADGYEAVGTPSIHRAALIVQRNPVSVVLVNLSEFPSVLLAAFARACGRHTETQLLAAFVVFSTDATDGGSGVPTWRHAVHWLTLGSFEDLYPGLLQPRVCN
jgi:hypothetical protein